MKVHIALGLSMVLIASVATTALASANGSAPTAAIGTAPVLAAAGDPVAGVTVRESSTVSYQFPARSFNAGATATEPDWSSGGGGGAGKSSLQPMTITKTFDQDTVRLHKAAVTGKHLQRVTIALGAGGSYVLSDVLVTLVKTSGGGVPVDTIRFSYAKLRLTKDGVVSCFSQVTFSTAC